MDPRSNGADPTYTRTEPVLLPFEWDPITTPHATEPMQPVPVTTTSTEHEDEDEDGEDELTREDLIGLVAEKVVTLVRLNLEYNPTSALRGTPP